MRIVEWSFKIENGYIYMWIHTFWFCDVKMWLQANETAISIPSCTLVLQNWFFFLLVFHFIFTIHMYTTMWMWMCMCNFASSQFRWLLGTFKAVQFIWFEVLTYSRNHFIHSLAALFFVPYFSSAHNRDRDRQIKWDSRLSLPAIISFCRLFYWKSNIQFNAI